MFFHQFASKAKKKKNYKKTPGFPWWLSWERIRLQFGRPGLNPWVGRIPWRGEHLPTPVSWPGGFYGLYSTWGCNIFRAKKKKIHPDLWVLSWSYYKALMYGFQAMNRTSTAFLKCSWNGLIETLSYSSAIMLPEIIKDSHYPAMVTRSCPPLWLTSHCKMP